MPLAVATYAPAGVTPVLTETVTRDHLSVSSGVTPAGKLALQVHSGALSSREVVQFLRYLEHRFAGPLLVIWDGAPIHRSHVVREFLTGHAPRLELVTLPSYAPELNPDEGVWHTLKRKELANYAAPDLDALAHALQLAKERLARRPAVIRGYFREVGYL